MFGHLDRMYLSSARWRLPQAVGTSERSSLLSTGRSGLFVKWVRLTEHFCEEDDNPLLMEDLRLSRDEYFCRPHSTIRFLNIRSLEYVSGPMLVYAVDNSHQSAAVYS
jgi:hypothetical protein